MIQVTNIVFDFTTDDDEVFPETQRIELENSIIGRTFDCDEEYICDVISDETGWCILDIDYVVLAECN